MKRLWPLLLVIVFIVVYSWADHNDLARAQEGPNHWVIYNDGTTRIVKVQDGRCSIYMSEPGTNSVQASPVQLIPGPGCRR